MQERRIRGISQTVKWLISLSNYRLESGGIQKEIESERLFYRNIVRRYYKKNHKSKHSRNFLVYLKEVIFPQ